MKLDTRTVLKFLIGILLALFLGLTSFILGFAYNYQQTVASESTAVAVPAKFPLMWEAWRLIKNEFYGNIPSAPTLVHGMIKGMLSSLGDPHTIFVDAQPAQLQANNLAGSYGGIGARVESRNGLLVLLPFQTGPAASAGIQPNDILMKIDDKEITPNMTTDDAEVLLRGDIGSTVHLTLHRVGVDQPIVLDIKREKIDIPSVEYRMLENTNYGYIRVSQESSDTAKEFEDALNSLNKNKPAGIVLDLRNNPGGIFPDPILSMAGQFLQANSPVVYEHYRDGTEKTYTSTGSGLDRNIPLVVLVNAGTASDAEILAGALQDSGRAILVGEKTFGKGSVQALHELSDKSSIHVTVATWLTPKHNQIEGTGLNPNLAVPLTPEDAAKGSDPQLDRAMQYLKNGK
ncbi:MAG: S41 family peptidase [Rudaea sp.]